MSETETAPTIDMALSQLELFDEAINETVFSGNNTALTLLSKKLEIEEYDAEHLLEGRTKLEELLTSSDMESTAPKDQLATEEMASYEKVLDTIAHKNGVTRQSLLNALIAHNQDIMQMMRGEVREKLAS